MTILRIIGIDPGSRITGYGVIERVKNRLCYIASGCIRLPNVSLPERVHQIFEDLSQVILEFKPNLAAVEQVFMHKNARSALILGQARGAALCALTHRGLAVAEYMPRQVKQAVVGYGAADKIQVQQMITQLLSLSGIPQADAADALAVAICHSQIYSYQVAFQQQLQR